MQHLKSAAEVEERHVIDHLSNSQIEEFNWCAKKYDLHYRQQLEPAFMPVNLIFGVSFHAAIEQYQRARKDGERLEFCDLLDAFEDQWSKEQLPVRFLWGQSAEECMSVAQAMFERYCSDPHDRGEVLAVEHPFEIVVATGMPPIVGRIDLIEKTAEGGLLVTDFKTASKPKEHGTSQLTLYVEAVRREFPDCDRVRARYVTITKSARPEILEQPLEPTTADIESMTARCVSAYGRIAEGQDQRHNGGWCLDCQWRSRCIAEEERPVWDSADVDPVTDPRRPDGPWADAFGLGPQAR